MEINQQILSDGKVLPESAFVKDRCRGWARTWQKTTPGQMTDGATHDLSFHTQSCKGSQRIKLCLCAFCLWTMNKYRLNDMKCFFFCFACHSKTIPSVGGDFFSVCVLFEGEWLADGGDCDHGIQQWWTVTHRLIKQSHIWWEWWEGWCVTWIIFSPLCLSSVWKNLFLCALGHASWHVIS